jgi:single-stranded-DNA-specific exonuclease
VVAALDALMAHRPAAEHGAEGSIPAPRADGSPAVGVAPRAVRDRRGGGIAGTVGALVASGEDVLVACADAGARRRHLEGRLGGFALCSWDALERGPALPAPFDHVVALDPPLTVEPEALRGAGMVHLVWGPPEAAYALAVAERDLGLRATLAALYRELRDGGGPRDRRGADLEAALRGPGPVPRPASASARLLAVLLELELVELDRGAFRARVLPAAPTELERSPTFCRSAALLESARRRLGTGPAAAVA